VRARRVARVEARQLPASRSRGRGQEIDEAGDRPQAAESSMQDRCQTVRCLPAAAAGARARCAGQVLSSGGSNNNKCSPGGGGALAHGTGSSLTKRLGPVTAALLLFFLFPACIASAGLLPFTTPLHLGRTRPQLPPRSLLCTHESCSSVPEPPSCCHCSPLSPHPPRPSLAQPPLHLAHPLRHTTFFSPFLHAPGPGAPRLSRHDILS
jgi:hypothetical protein